METKKSKLGLGIFIGVLIGLIIGLSGFIIYDKVIENDKDKQEIKKDNIQKKDDETDDKIDNTPSDNKNNNDGTELTDFDITKFDNTKPAINGDKEMAYKLTSNPIANIGLSIRLNNDKRSATITINWSKYFEIYGISITTGETREYNVTNFNKNIKDVYISGFGGGTGYETAFYIMEDGTVEYTPIKYALGNNGSSSTTILKSYGQIPGVSGVVKMVIAEEYCLYNSSCVGLPYNILGIKSDGSFYDISKILNESYSNYYQNF